MEHAPLPLCCRWPPNHVPPCLGELAARPDERLKRLCYVHPNSDTVVSAVVSSTQHDRYIMVLGTIPFPLADARVSLK